MERESIAQLLDTQYNKSVLQTQELGMCLKAKQIPCLGVFKTMF